MGLHAEKLPASSSLLTAYERLGILYDKENIVKWRRIVLLPVHSAVFENTSIFWVA